MQEDYLPEIRNLKEPCHREINFVRDGGDFSFGTCIIENFGFGGQNSTLVVKRANELFFNAGL
jgi:3-oxoacyl-[acyl-carrier-protein] synthase II